MIPGPFTFWMLFRIAVHLAGPPAATSGRTTGVLAATLATTGAGLRWTMTFAPSDRITGSVQATPRRAATVTAAVAFRPLSEEKGVCSLVVAAQ